MPIFDYFSSDYLEARGKFTTAAHNSRAELQSFVHPTLFDPSGNQLSVDVAFFGSRHATRCILLCSGTHGVEGFAGSGCQVGFCCDNLIDAFDDNTCAILIHALNPYGFAWLRRVNEDNVDINRNFQDFHNPLPKNDPYLALHDALIPPQWTGPDRDRAEKQIEAYIASHGAAHFQSAVTSGQYTHANGLFYGGSAETWSAQTFKTILGTIPGSVKELIAIDIHSGLGAYGYGEPLFAGGTGQQFQRARAEFGPELKNVYSCASVSSIVTGSIADGAVATLRGLDVTFIALEFGTKPIVEVINALRGDHWLHASKSNDQGLRETLSQQLKAAFYIETPHWMAAVYGRTADFIVRASRALRT